jgi:hypothetical protein
MLTGLSSTADPCIAHSPLFLKKFRIKKIDFEKKDGTIGRSKEEMSDIM